jgi:hypothetical protein
LARLQAKRVLGREIVVALDQRARRPVVAAHMTTRSRASTVGPVPPRATSRAVETMCDAQRPGLAGADMLE